MTKYSRYQDYVIRDGHLVGEFDEMYKDFNDPWEQSSREAGRSEKVLTIWLCKKYKISKIVEVGCGLGHFSNKMNRYGLNVTGVDISHTAIEKASQSYPECSFICGDILDFDIYEQIKPDCILLSEVTWYILDKLKEFLSYYKKITWGGKKPYLLHLLSLYPQDQQKYGREYFTDLNGILRYFNLDYEEYGLISYKDLNWCSRSYFFARAKDC